MLIEYGKIYEFNLRGQVSWGDIPIKTVYELCKDGRVSSKFLEHHIPIWFPELKFVDKKGFDHIRVDDHQIKFDLKSFTKSGSSWLPSSMIGVGRTVNLEEASAHANTIDYIFTDVTEFPIVRMQIWKGADLVDRFPKGKIKHKQIDELFNGHSINEEK
jgi:hypothetical protein